MFEWFRMSRSAATPPTRASQEREPAFKSYIMYCHFEPRESWFTQHYYSLLSYTSVGAKWYLHINNSHVLFIWSSIIQLFHNPFCVWTIHVLFMRPKTFGTCR